MESTGLLEDTTVESALRKKVKTAKWLELDLAALALGWEEMRKIPAPVSDEALWAV